MLLKFTDQLTRLKKFIHVPGRKGPYFVPFKASEIFMIIMIV